MCNRQGRLRRTHPTRPRNFRLDKTLRNAIPLKGDIDVKEDPKVIYETQVKILEDAGLKIHEVIELEPFEKDHAMIIASI